MQLYDDLGRPAGTTDRRRMRTENLTHAATAVVLRDPLGRVFVHRRTDTKDVYPGRLDFAAGGVVDAGEEPAARRSPRAGRGARRHRRPARADPVARYTDDYTDYWGHCFTATAKDRCGCSPRRSPRARGGRSTGWSPRSTAPEAAPARSCPTRPDCSATGCASASPTGCPSPPGLGQPRRQRGGHLARPHRAAAGRRTPARDRVPADAPAGADPPARRTGPILLGHRPAALPPPDGRGHADRPDAAHHRRRRAGWRVPPGSARRPGRRVGRHGHRPRRRPSCPSSTRWRSVWSRCSRVTFACPDWRCSTAVATRRTAPCCATATSGPSTSSSPTAGSPASSTGPTSLSATRRSTSPGWRSGPRRRSPRR